MVKKLALLKYFLNPGIKNVTVDNEQEMAHSECNSQSKNRGGKKQTKLTIRY